jgi:WD40 repeat protein
MDTSGGGTSPPPHHATGMDTSQSSQRSASGISGGISGATAATAAGNTTSTSTTSSSSISSSKYNPTDQAVLEYLKSKGMGSAVLELQSRLKEKQKQQQQQQQQQVAEQRVAAAASAASGAEVPPPPEQASSIPPLSSTKILKEQLEREEDHARNQRLALTKSTGGGFGYDLDNAAPIIQWGVPDTPAPTTAAAVFAGATAGATTGATTGTKQPQQQQQQQPPPPPLGVHEARAYLDAFCALQLWVLSLPDDDNATDSTSSSYSQTTNVIAKAKQLIQQGQDAANNGDPTQKVSLSTLMQELAASSNSKSSSSSSLEPPTAAAAQQGQPSTTATTDAGAAATAATATAAVGSSNDDANANANATAPQQLQQQQQQSHTNYTTATTAATTFQLPPSAKPELLAVTFALLIHTYCELLEVGMETTAHVLRDAFRPIYEPLYGDALTDLDKCTTTEDVVKLNTHNSQHMEALQGLKSILIQIASLQLRQEEVAHAKPSSNTPPEQQQQQQQQRAAKIQEYNQTIAILRQKHSELSKRASQAFDRMYNLPFLRRARAVRWQLTLSTNSYALLAAFLNTTTSQSSSLLAMSTLLQTKCELHVERREPVPFIPAIVLEDADMVHTSKDKKKRQYHSAEYINETALVNWAAPVPPSALKLEMAAAKNASTAPPFPPYHLQEEYDDERSARRDKRSVEFNRALLIHGFRRLEALERKREFDVMANNNNNTNTANNHNNNHPHNSTAATGNKFDNSAHKSSSGGIGGGGGEEEDKDGKDDDDDDDDDDNSPHNIRSSYQLANPLEPSILLSTLCANDEMTMMANEKGSGTNGNNKTTTTAPDGSSGRKPTMSTSLWEEAGIGLTCCKLAPPDGRRVAVGCDDAAVRIWDLQQGQDDDAAASREVCQVLLGHKNGFPVFDVSWNRDGRSLLSAGGDGSIRLWDTMAQGPFGKVSDEPLVPLSANLSPKKPDNKPLTNATAKEALNKSTASLQQARHQPDMSVPGLKPENKASYESGAALAVYRGHAPNTPVWSVAFAPSGYYFASAGGDATARLWTTDRPTPVRLFAGHTSDSVHSVCFHPNTNYILTGSEDKTARLWDIQTGRCVRLLNGCNAGIHQVQVDPSGQYAVGADATGTIHMWDLGTGKKVTEFRAKKMSSSSSSYASGSRHAKSNWGMLHAMSFSACGTALATGGDDQCVRIWDIQQAIRGKSPVVEYPRKSFPTRRTMILDLDFTKRNLLLSVGKYISAVPLVNPISD